MPEGLDGFIKAELLDKNVPLKIVLKLEDAHIVLSGAGSTNDNRSWHEGWLTMEKDHATGSAMIVDRASKQIIWAGEAGDRSLWWGAFARGGPRKVASRLVDDIKDAIMPSTTDLPAPPPLSDEERVALNQLAQQSAVAMASNAGGAMKPLTNEDIVKLVTAGVGEDVILPKIQATPAAFRLETDDILALKKAGVSDRIVTAMIEASKRK
jgi:hypothetical protein